MRAIPKVSQAQLKYFLKLTSKKYREREKKILIEGEKLVDEALHSEWELETILLHRDFLMGEHAREILRRAELLHCEVLEISKDELKRLSDTVTSQNIIGVVSPRDVRLESLLAPGERRALIVALDAVADPGNVGTIFRTCDWFGVDGVLMNRNSVELFNPKVVRSAMGSLFHLPVVPNAELTSALQGAKKNGFKVIVTVAEGGSMFSAVVPPRKSILVFGNEAHGVSSEIVNMADEVVTIPKLGKAESLNVAIAAGIVIGFWRMGVQTG